MEGREWPVVEGYPREGLDLYPSDGRSPMQQELGERVTRIAERVLDNSLIQYPSWDDGKPLKYRVEVSLSELGKLPKSLADYGFKKL